VSIGYHDVVIYKLTCGLRAGLFLFIKALFGAKAPAEQPARLFFKIFRTTVSHAFPWLYRCCDRLWPEDKIAKADPASPGPSFYIVIAALARK
jgi:hypothetical protein